MLMLIVKTGEELYAIDARSIIEVLPLVECRTLPRAPLGILGVINHHGAPVPVLDLAEFVVRRPSSRRMSTRIVIVDYDGGSGKTHPLGIVMEHAIETRSLNESDFVTSGVATPDAVYLGPVAATEHGIIQKLDPQKVFPVEVRTHLFAALEDYAASTD
jgi:chemotaxis-related protein WspB